MKIIDAKWEKRNFGYDVTEVNIDSFDTLDEINNALAEINSSYIVVKAPIKRIDLYRFLSNKGFCFVESLIDFSLNELDSLEINKIKNKYEYKVFYEYNADIKIVFESIKSGNIFNTDRVFLDQKFSKEISGLRYYNWATDLLSRGG